MVRIKIVVRVGCSADAAWEAAHSPAVAERLYRPLLRMQPRDGAPFPARFDSGDRIDVTLLLFRACAVGVQQIVIEDLIGHGDGCESRSMRDAGRPVSGPLSLLSSWNHEITISPAGRRAAIWHDELTVGGAFAPVAAVILWPMWHWRAVRLRKLARDWNTD